MSNVEPFKRGQGHERPSGGAEGGRFEAVLPMLVAEVAREVTTERVASRIVRSFVAALGARAARVYLKESNGDALRLAAAEHAGHPNVATAPSPDGEDDPVAAAAVRFGLMQVHDAVDCELGRLAVGRPGTVLALPLFAGEATVGAVTAQFDELDPKDCVALTVLSESLGAFVDGARLRAEVAQLGAIARARDEAMTLVVHELRQPLTTLVLAASLLATRSTHDEQRVLDRLRVGGLRLSKLVSDLSDRSFLDSGMFELHVVRSDIAGLLAASVARLAPAASVEVEGVIPSIDVDPARFDQILANLLGNAQKYGIGATAPQVSLAQRGGVVVIAITNDGIPIPEDERTRVFEAHYRGRDRKPGAGGQGLGLYICKRLVEEHGGRIWTDGDPAHTRFSFSFPVLDATAHASGTLFAAVARAGD